MNRVHWFLKIFMSMINKYIFEKHFYLVVYDVRSIKGFWQPQFPLKNSLRDKTISKHASSVSFSIKRLQQLSHCYSNLVMVFWESVSIGAGHITPAAITLAFQSVSANSIFTPSDYKYSPLHATLNCHSVLTPPPNPDVFTCHHPWSRDCHGLGCIGNCIFSRRRRVRWWPFSPVVAGTHERAQRPASRSQTDKTKPKSAGFTMSGFLFSRLLLFSEENMLIQSTKFPSVTVGMGYTLQKFFWARLLWAPPKVNTNKLTIKVNIFSKLKIFGRKKLFVINYKCIML